MTTSIQALGAHESPSIKQHCIQGLYVHTPFCFHKCHYCDFYSIVQGESADREQAFVDQLIAELKYCAARYVMRPKTIFVGGGTPTLLSAAAWQRLLAVLHDSMMLECVEEFTVEANPETVTGELMALLAGAGVTRLSIGCQSFHRGLLEALQRWHEPTRVAAAVHMARAAGIENLNLDLIFAIPGQSLSMFEADLEAAVALAPAHLSCYALTYEPNTPMTQRLRTGQIKRVAEEVECQMYEFAIDWLAAHDFEHYEVSSWAKGPGTSQATCSKGRTTTSTTRDFRCQHNLLYWRNANWIGVGPSAASHVDGHRWKNVAHLGRYLAAGLPPTTTDHERLSKPQRIGEHLMLALRMREGICVRWLQENLPPTDPRQAAIQEFLDHRLLEQHNDHLRLTRRGLLLADSVLARLL